MPNIPQLTSLRTSIRIFGLIVAATIFAASCGGESPTTPESAAISESETSQGAGAPPSASFESGAPEDAGAAGSGSAETDPSEVPASATAAASQLSTLTMQALRMAVGAPPLAQASGVLGNPSSDPTEGAYRVDCPESGYMEMTQLPDRLPFIGEVWLVDVVEVYKECAYFEDGSPYTANGTLTVNGSYLIAENAPQNIQVAGDLATTPGEDCPVDGRVAADGAFAGTICAWPITIDPLPAAPAGPTPAELLAGPWSGRAVYSDTSFGCSGKADFTFALGGSGENLKGTYTFTVGDSIGPDALCSRGCDNSGVVGCSERGSLSGTARDGVINFAAGGLTVQGEYRYDGQWMVGSYQGTVLGGFFVTGDWQTILK